MSQQPAYRFGEFLLDPAMRELRHGDGEVSLPPKSFECLVYLLEHRDRAVGRDELISAVWGRVDVSDAVLAQTLLRARRAVGDTGSEQTTFRTIPRFGYRWVAPVSLEQRSPADTEEAPANGEVARVGDAGAPEAAPNSPAPSVSTPPPWMRRAAWVAAALVLAVAAWSFRHSWSGREAGEPAPSGAKSNLAMVLPVAMDASASPEQAWVRLGAMDYISSRLRGNGGLSVLPSGQVLQMVEGSAAGDTDALARRLLATTGAQWVVRPSVTAGHDGWVVRLQVTGAQQDGMDVEARGKTALAAAAVATDSLLRRLGRMRKETVQAPTALAERLQQIDAELLAGQLSHARALVQGAQPALRDAPELRLREGQVEFRAGRVAEAGAIFGRLLDGSVPLADDVRAQASMGLGAAAVRSGDYRVAEQRYGEAVELLARDETVDPTLLGNAYNGRGIARLELGNEAEAIADIGRARLAMQRAGNDLEVAAVDTNLGMLESRRGNDTRAMQQFDRAIATFERFGVNDNLVAVLQAKASAQMNMAQPAAALATISRAAARSDKVENPILRQRVGLVRAAIDIANGRLREAGDVLAHLGESPQGPTAADTLALRLLLNRGADRDAVQLARTLAAREDAGEEAVLLGVQAALRVGDGAAARAWLARTGAGDRSGANWTLARALSAAHDKAGAEAAFVAAEAAAAGDGSPSARIDAGCAHAAWLIAAGNTDRASAILGEITTLADNDYRIAHTTLALYRALDDAPAIRTSESAVRELAGQRDPALPLVY